MFNSAYRGRRIFLTGHTGFKGSWLSLWLKKLGAVLCGYSLAPNTTPSMFNALKIDQIIDKSIIGDILDENKLNNAINEFRPSIVFHLAAQPIVRLSYIHPVETYKTNVIGSLNVLEAARFCPSVKVFVNVTTDKCYENVETECGYQEDDPMGGYDMYSSSKGCVEIMSSSYRRSFLHTVESMSLATARAGNVIGGGDWASDRLIPDCIRAIMSDRKIEIRNPNAVRPWQHVLEPLSGYLLLGQKLLEDRIKFATAFNFGPNQSSVIKVSSICNMLIDVLGKGQVVIDKSDNFHEANLLMLNIKKAEKLLKWTPSYSVEKTVNETARWYQSFYDKNTDMLDFTLKQIDCFEKAILKNRL